MRIAITGISGFIGGQIALNMRDLGHEVFGIDRRPLPKNLESTPNLFYRNDFDNEQTYDKLVAFDPQAIVHCAGTSLVGPSIENPIEYYQNNVVKTLHLLDFTRHELPKTRIMFSSSASVYGVTKHICDESSLLNPVSPYGESKRMVEQMLLSFHRAYKLDFIAFRYFNACGADSQGRHGQESGATHLVAKILESVKFKRDFICNGNDYDTHDGTCVRDYIHVEDIARAHILALNKEIPAGIYNLGTGQGNSNLEVIEQASQVTKSIIPVIYGPRRAGDPDSLTADSNLFQQTSNWKPQFKLKDMIEHAWTWYNNDLIDNDLNNHYNSR